MTVYVPSYKEAGEGPAVLFLHGLGVSSWMAEEVGRFARSAFCVAFRLGEVAHLPMGGGSDPKTR